MPPYNKEGIARIVPTTTSTTENSNSIISSMMDIDPSTPSSSTSAQVPAGGHHDIPSKIGNFELLAQEKLDYSDITIAKWRSTSTGLKVVWADVEGPFPQLPLIPSSLLTFFVFHRDRSISTRIFQCSNRNF